MIEWELCFGPAERVDPEDLRRARGEFLEMPGLRLTSAQAQRLWALERTTCETLLAALVAEKFLRRTPDGAFTRADSGTPGR
jgi:hypothetical protein